MKHQSKSLSFRDLTPVSTQVPAGPRRPLLQAHQPNRRCYPNCKALFVYNFLLSKGCNNEKEENKCKWCKTNVYDELLESANTATPQPPKGQNTMPRHHRSWKKVQKETLGCSRSWTTVSQMRRCPILKPCPAARLWALSLLVGWAVEPVS